MTSSFKATTPGGAPIAWDDAQGFSNEFADELNAALRIAPGQTITPPAELARRVLLEELPGAVISDFVSVPLEPLSPDVLS